VNLDDLEPRLAVSARPPIFNTGRTWHRRRVKSMWRFVVLLVPLALGVSSAGCSFTFTDTVPSDHAKMPYFDCTSTYGLATADGLFTLSGAIGAGSILSQSKQDYADKNNGASRNVAAGADIILAGLTAASGIYGAYQATQCNRAKDELRARIFAAPLRPPPSNFVPHAAPLLPAPPAGPVPELPPAPEVVPAPPPAAPAPAPSPSPAPPASNGWVPVPPSQ
jgi:hypothetical protein